MNSTKKAIIERVKGIDVVIEMLDARLPASSGNPLLARAFGLLAGALAAAEAASPLLPAGFVLPDTFMPVRQPLLPGFLDFDFGFALAAAFGSAGSAAASSVLAAAIGL